jgi:anti-sigma B factor antagonist
MSFVAATEQLKTGQPVVSVMGEVDVASVEALEQTLLDVAEDPADELIVDLSACSFLDARGLRALIATGERRRQLNRRLSIVLSNPNVMRIFQITRFDQRFAIYPTLAAALNPRGTRLA